MNKCRISRIVTTVISLAAFLTPIIYGLSQNNWNVQYLITPQYTPPKVGFELEQASISFVGSNLSIIVEFQAKNTGEVELRIISLNAKAQDPDGADLGKPELVQPLVLLSGETKTLTMNLSLTSQALEKLHSYFVESDQVAISIVGEAQVGIFSSTINAPLATSFTLSAEGVTGP